MPRNMTTPARVPGLIVLFVGCALALGVPAPQAAEPGELRPSSHRWYLMKVKRQKAKGKSQKAKVRRQK
jgi:hypothetical protein